MIRRMLHNDTGGISGQIKIKLLTGRRLVASMAGPLPTYITIEVPPDLKAKEGTLLSRGSRVVCKRVDLEKYEQMTVNEMIEDGILHEDPFMQKDQKK